MCADIVTYIECLDPRIADTQRFEFALAYRGDRASTAHTVWCSAAAAAAGEQEAASVVRYVKFDDVLIGKKIATVLKDSLVSLGQGTVNACDKKCTAAQDGRATVLERGAVACGMMEQGVNGWIKR